MDSVSSLQKNKLHPNSSTGIPHGVKKSQSPIQYCVLLSVQTTRARAHSQYDLWVTLGLIYTTVKQHYCYLYLFPFGKARFSKQQSQSSRNNVDPPCVSLTTPSTLQIPSPSCPLLEERRMGNLLPSLLSPVRVQCSWTVRI